MNRKIICFVVILTFIMSMLTFPVTAATFTPVEMNEVVISGTEINGNNAVACKASAAIPSLGMEKKQWAKYNIDVSVSGTYKIKAVINAHYNENAVVELRHSEMCGTIGEVNPSIYDKKVCSATGTGIGWSQGDKESGQWLTDAQIAVELDLGYIELNEGKQSLTFVVGNGGNIRLRRFYIEGISKERETQFLNRVKSLENTQDMVEFFEDKSNYEDLITDYSALLDKVFYKERIFSQLNLIKNNSLTLIEFDDYFKSFVNEEYNNPLVTVKQNSQLVTEISAGAMEIHAGGGRFTESVTAIAALYDLNGNLKKALSRPLPAFGEAVFTELPAATDTDELRVMFWDDMVHIKPVKLPLIQDKIYVDTDGNDSNDGTVTRPVKTFSGATKRVKELMEVTPSDITVYFSEGEHFVEDTVVMDETYGGKNGFKVTYTSLNPENPAVITGGIRVSGWEDEDKDGIYTLEVPEEISDMRQMYIDGYPAQRAKGEWLYRADERWDDVSTDYDEDGFVVKKRTEKLFPVLTKPQDAELVYRITWCLQRVPLDNIVYDEEMNTATVKPAQPYYTNMISVDTLGGKPVIGRQFYLENDLSLLDSEGEFYFDKDEKLLYYKPFEEENLADADTVIAQTEQLISANGSNIQNKISNIIFDNLIFRYGAYYTDVNREGIYCGQAECILNHEYGTGQNVASTGTVLPAQLSFTNADGIVFSNCDISCMGSTALGLRDGVTNCSVTGCVMRDNGGSAVSVGYWRAGRDTLPYNVASEFANNITISNNVITRPGVEHMFTPAISVYYGYNVDVIHNTIWNTPYDGISLNWGWSYYSKDIKDGEGNTVTETVLALDDDAPEIYLFGGHRIDNNRIYDTSNAVEDGGQIYMLGYMRDVSLKGNYLSESTDQGGIYFDCGSSGVTVESNVVDTSSRWITGGAQTVESIIRNNYTDTSNHGFHPPTYDKLASLGRPELTTIFEEAVVCSDGNWSKEAQNIMLEAGVTKEYSENISYGEISKQREKLYYSIPTEEYLSIGEIYIAGNEYYNFGKVGAGKTEPLVTVMSGIKGIRDFRVGEAVGYKFDVEDGGEYLVTLDYSTGSENEGISPVIDIFVNFDDSHVTDSNRNDWSIYKDAVSQFGAINLPFTLTDWGAHKSIELGRVTLNKGTNNMWIRNARTGSSGFGYRGFRLTPISALAD